MKIKLTEEKARKFVLLVMACLLLSSSVGQASSSDILCDNAPCPPTLSIAPGSPSSSVSVRNSSGVWTCNVFNAQALLPTIPTVPPTGAMYWVFVPIGSAEEMETFKWAVSDPDATAAADPNMLASDNTHPYRMCCGISNLNTTLPSYVYPGAPDGHPPNALLQMLPRLPSRAAIGSFSACAGAYPATPIDSVQIVMPNLDASSTTAVVSSPSPTTPAPSSPVVTPGNLASIISPPMTPSASGGGDGGDGDGADGDGG